MATPEHNRALREMLRVLREENARLEHQVRAAERGRQRLELYEYAADSALIAIRILAKAVSSKTVEGKKARAEARQVLEERGLTPPGTLGSSRVRKRRRRHPVDRTGSS